MSFELIFVIVLVLSIAFILIYFLFINKEPYKSPAVKKQEIIEDYKEEMRVIVQEGDTEKKITFLKKVNQELAMNLFFDENEAKELLHELSKI